MKRPTIVLVVNSVGLSLSFFAVVLRFYTRVVRRKRFNLSDYTILASWVSWFPRGHEGISQYE